MDYNHDAVQVFVNIIYGCSENLSERKAFLLEMWTMLSLA